jgi:anti-anti-sigma factor
MFDTNIAGDKKNGTLTLTGDLTVNNIDRIRDALLETISRFKKITVKIEALEHIDFACFQLFCAAHKSAANQKKSMVVVPPPESPFLKMLEYSGFAHITDQGYQARGFTIEETG